MRFIGPWTCTKYTESQTLQQMRPTHAEMSRHFLQMAFSPFFTAHGFIVGIGMSNRLLEYSIERLIID